MCTITANNTGRAQMSSSKHATRVAYCLCKYLFCQLFMQKRMLLQMLSRRKFLFYGNDNF